MPTDYRVKIKVSEKTGEINASREQKRLWNMKVKVIPILIEAIGTVPKNLEKKLGN